MGAIEKDRMLEFRGGDLADRDGEKIGRIEEIYLDADSGEPEWALIHTGLLGTKRSFVPLADATEVDGQLRVPLDKDTVKDAPGVEPNGRLSETEEADLLAHYEPEQAAGGTEPAAGGTEPAAEGPEPAAGGPEPAAEGPEPAAEGAEQAADDV